MSNRFGGNAKVYGIRGTPHRALTTQITPDGRRVNRGLPMVMGGHAGGKVFITEPEKVTVKHKKPLISVDGQRISKKRAHDDVIRIRTKLPDEP